MVELLIGLVILAILAAVAAPSFRAASENAELRRASSDLVAALNTARSQAVSLRIPVDVQPLAGGWANGWRVAYQYPPSVPANQQTESDSDFVQPGNVTVATGAATIRFQANGFVAGGGETFDLCRSGRGRTITVSALGRIDNEEVVC